MESEFSDSPALRARISQFHGCTSSRISRGLGSDGHRMGIRRHSMDLPVDGIQERHRRDVEDRRRPDICDVFHDLGSRDPFRSEVDRRQRSGGWDEMEYRSRNAVPIPQSAQTHCPTQWESAPSHACSQHGAFREDCTSAIAQAYRRCPRDQSSVEEVNCRSMHTTITRLRALITRGIEMKVHRVGQRVPALGHSELSTRRSASSCASGSNVVGRRRVLTRLQLDARTRCLHAMF